MKNIKVKYYLLLIGLLWAGLSFSQVDGTGYCSCKTAPYYKVKAKSGLHKVYAITGYDTNNIIVSIINPTKDTLFLFNSYLQPQFYASQHLHRVDLKERIYKISFLPLVSNLFVKYADNITDDLIIGQNQVVYDFIKLPPDSKADIRIDDEHLLSYTNQKNNVSDDYNVKKLHKYSKTPPTKFRTINILKTNFKTEFEFALYKSVSLLCNQAAFYTKEYEFDKQSKEFTILTAPFKIKK